MSRRRWSREGLQTGGRINDLSHRTRVVPSVNVGQAPGRRLSARVGPPLSGVAPGADSVLWQAVEVPVAVAGGRNGRRAAVEGLMAIGATFHAVRPCGLRDRSLHASPVGMRPCLTTLRSGARGAVRLEAARREVSGRRARRPDGAQRS